MTRRFHLWIALSIMASLVMSFPVPLGAVVLAQQAPGSQAGVIVGEVVGVRPESRIQRGSSQLAAAEAGQIREGDTLVTGSQGRLRVELQDDSELNLGSRTRLQVSRHQPRARQTRLALESGVIRGVVEGLEPQQKFEIETPAALVGVVVGPDTDFQIESERDRTVVVVFTGRVQVSNPAGQVQLSGGQQTTVGPNQPPSPATAAPQGQLQAQKQKTALGQPSGPPSSQKWLILGGIAAGVAAVVLAVTFGTDDSNDVEGQPSPSPPPSQQFP